MSKRKIDSSSFLPDADDDSSRKSNKMTEGKRLESWRRPSFSAPFDPRTMDLRFQKLEIDYITGDPLLGMPGAQRAPVPIIRMWGVTSEGVSVQCNVHGFCPYLYVRAPLNFRESDCEEFRELLNSAVEESIINYRDRAPCYVLKVSIHQKESIRGFSPIRTPFLQIIVTLPNHIPILRKILETGFSFPDGATPMVYGTYESNLPFILRFMIDIEMGGGFWLNLVAGTYTLTRASSACQIEVDVSYLSVISLKPESAPENSDMAPFRVLSFDIECKGRKGCFPDPEKDPVIQIANYVTIQGQSQPIIRNIFNLDTCDPIPGADVIEFKTEDILLLKWAEFVRACDPDIIIGYNISNFDFPYLLNRAKKLKLDGFFYLGKVRESAARMKERTFTSKAFGTRKSMETTLDGRVILDVMQAIQRDKKLSSYSLNAVSSQFLGERKEDVHHSNISTLFMGTSQDRKRLAVYCLKDAYLPQRLLEKLLIVYNYIEMVRVTGVPLSFLLSRGQSIKVVSQVYRMAREDGLLIPYYSNDEARAGGNGAGKGDAPKGKGYKGATVIEPIRGYHTNPIMTLDFASLYPSIMLAHNLSYDTLLDKMRIPMGFVEGVDFEMSPTPAFACFVLEKHKKGILPKILSRLLAARRQARVELAKESDPLRKACLDARQLALKVSANSVYGFTGATIGQLPCIEISGSVTAYGRMMIDLTQNTVQEHYRKANGYPFDAVVIYGDTDSVMVDFGDITLEQAMTYGKEAAGLVTKKFVTPIKLEFEKGYWPYLLISKKRYAGLFWTRLDKYDKIDSKGLETVRRDNCGLVKDIANAALNKILVERNPLAAVEYVKHKISELLRNEIDLSLLIITKGYTKEDYGTAKYAHIELAKRMHERDPNTAPAVGDRIPFVVVKGHKKAKLFEKIEDPIYVLEHGIPLDYQYYLQNQLRKPLTRIFRAILPNVEVLFEGEHTRVITNPTPVSGGIMGFIQKRKQCIRCRVTMNKEDEEFPTCAACRPKEVDSFIQQNEILRQAEQKFCRLWTQCQACQGSLIQPVICSSRDCPLFYTRKKVQKEVSDLTIKVNEFKSIEW
jgi:DNA polymerase delta subunit 1